MKTNTFFDAYLASLSDENKNKETESVSYYGCII